MTKRSRSGRGRGTRKKKRSLTWLYVVGGLVAFGGVIALLGRTTGSAVGESFTTLPANHIEPGESHIDYNTDPPTSGPHYVSPAREGFYETVIPDETLVHNLEHGYVIVWYDCSELDADGCTEMKSRIRQVTDSNSFHVVVVPRDGMEGQIALTSWGRLDRLDAFDAERIDTFIESNRNREAPEAGAQ